MQNSGMSKTLSVRNLPDDVYRRFALVAEREHRSAEAQARYLIERAALPVSAETCGELLDAYAHAPSPAVDADALASHLARRGRRSPRP
jgi:plasmid stability protein